MANTNASNSQPVAGLYTRPNVKGGAIIWLGNHNHTLATERGLKVRTSAKAGTANKTPCLPSSPLAHVHCIARRTSTMTDWPKRSTKRFTVSIISTILLLAPAWSPNRAAAQTYSAAGDFSATSNPNGSWSYGWSTSRLSGFNLLPQSLKFDVDVTGALLNPAIADVWTGAPSGDVAPSVFHNPAPFVDTHSSYPFGCCAPYPVAGLGFHPGPNGENAKVRWTAPASGVYKVKATFSGLDYGGQVGTTTDVAVLYSRFDGGSGGTKMTYQLWTGNVIAFGSHYDQSFSGIVRVGARDTIDFAVGYGTVASGNDFVLYPFANYYSDSTGLDATITPEGQVLTNDVTNLINGSSLAPGQITRLENGVQAITAALASGNNDAAITELRALVGAVLPLLWPPLNGAAAPPPPIPVTLAEPLINDAIETIAALE